MKLRLLPMLFAVIGSSVLLFGGWFVYRSMAMEEPLARLLEQTTGVESVQADIGSRKAVLNLKLDSQANLREIVHHITKNGASIIGNRALELNLESNSTPELEQWWSRAIFDVAQAMETRQYAQIPVTLAEKAGHLPSMKVETEMDDKNVYVHLTDGEHNKYVVLPRNPGKLGVWPNE